MTNDWLETLKAGDEVAVQGRDIYPHVRLYTVERVTPTQIVLPLARYRRRDGMEIGATSRRWLIKATPEMRERLKREALCAKLSGAKWAALNTDTLVLVAAILEASADPVKG